MLHRPQTRDLLRRTALDAPPTRDFAGALRREDGTIAVIAEIKRRSPSKGDLAPDLDAGRHRQGLRARRGVAPSACSPTAPFFGGTVEDLQTVRADGRAAGAAQGLHHRRGAGLRDPGHRRRRDPPDPRRAARRRATCATSRTWPGRSVSRSSSRRTTRPSSNGASRSEPRILGVNARDLSTFDEHLDSVADVAARIPTETIAVAESAIRRPEDAARMAAAGFDAVLVGEALVRADDAAALVGALGAATVATRKGTAVIRFDLGTDQIPTAWYNALPDLPEPMQPPLHPGTKEPIGPDDLAPLFPMGADRAGDVDRPVDRHPGRGARHPAPVAADAARARDATRAAPRHAGAHLLQGRVGVARGLAQAEHRGAAGLLQQGRGHDPAHHRDRRRASGAPRCRSRAASSTSTARCTWCGRASSRSRTGGS